MTIEQKIAFISFATSITETRGALLSALAKEREKLEQDELEVLLEASTKMNQAINKILDAVK